VEKKYRKWDAELLATYSRKILTKIGNAPELRSTPPSVVIAVYHHWLRKRYVHNRPLIPRLEVVLKDKENEIVTRLLAITKVCGARFEV
jgi:hypothetical protein